MSDAAQDETAAAQMDAIVARVSATVAATLRAELAELRSLSQYSVFSRKFRGWSRELKNSKSSWMS